MTQLIEDSAGEGASGGLLGPHKAALRKLAPTPKKLMSLEHLAYGATPHVARELVQQSEFLSRRDCSTKAIPSYEHLESVLAKRARAKFSQKGLSVE